MPGNNPSLISGDVRDGQGRPLAGARVFLVSGPVPFPDIAALTDEQGRFTLSLPAPGAYAMRCAAEGFADQTIDITVSQGQKQRVSISLQ